MKRVLLDTHVWIWWSVEAHKHLSRKALETLEQAEEKWISAISLWELAKLVERGRIAFSIPLLEWMKRSLQEEDISVAPLEPEICVESCSLQGFHRDPADQLIVATARVHSIPLITADERIQKYPGVKTLW